MTTPRHLLSVVALLLTAGCGRRGDAADAGAPEAGAPETIAPLVFPLGYPDVIKHPEVRTTEDPRWSKDAPETVELDDTFLLEVGMGGGRDGLNLTTVPASGHASHAYRVQENGEIRFRRVTFDVQRAELERLRQVLNDNRFLGLAQRYEELNAHDGAQWIVHVRTRGRDKYVSASNTFPEPLVAIARFVGAELVDKRPDLREKSKPSRLGSDLSAHLWRAARRYGDHGPDAELPSFADAARVAAVVLPDDPLPEGARLDASIVDRDDADKVLSSAVAERPKLWVFYDAEKVDLRHHYALVVKLGAEGKVLAASEALPVITYDGAHALEVPLPRP